MGFPDRMQASRGTPLVVQLQNRNAAEPVETPVVRSKETPPGATRTPIAQDFLSLVRSLNAPGGFEAEEDELAAEDTPDAQPELLTRLDDAAGAHALEGGKKSSSGASAGAGGGGAQATEHRDLSQHGARAHAEEHAEEHMSRRVVEAEEETPLCCVCTEPLEAGTDASDEWVYTAALRVDSHVRPSLSQQKMGARLHVQRGRRVASTHGGVHFFDVSHTHSGHSHTPDAISWH